MLTFNLWKCSCSFVASVASIVALVSVIHIFLTPIFPSSIDYFGAKIARNSCSPINASIADNACLDENLQLGIDRYPIDSHGAVIYRGAPWKPEIGRWLSGCEPVSAPSDVVENIGGERCKYDCSGQGVCNRELGQCRCFHGFSGEGCTKKLQLDCNLPSSPEQPYGHWIVSICPAHCDTSRAMCFCGEGTKYPNRPVAEDCGFKINLPVEPGGQETTDWSKADLENIFTTNISKPGWCNIDPEEAHASEVKYKQECQCKYDGLWGQFCEIPSVCTCLNQCSGNGHCRGGFCQCDNGWYGIDCSIPSTLSAIQEWPMWLRPSTVDVPDKGPLDRDMNIKAIVKKKRPLIYVYDLPPEFNSHLLEGRHFKYECVNRLYTDENRTSWTTQLYGSQIALYESILASPYRTLNGDEADYFYVPVLDSCIISRAYHAPHLSLRDHGNIRSSLALEFYKKAYDHIIEEYPYWNRSSGRDHMWFFSWDEGACCAPKEIWNSIMLVHWGNTNSKHNRSTTAYWPDNWDAIPAHKRGDHPCFEPDKDLVLPAWKKPDPGAIWLKLWSRPREERTTFFYFNGNLGPAYANGRPQDTYSMGIRQKVAEEFGSTPNEKGKLGRQHTSNVIVTPLRTTKYYEELSRSVFCGVLPGDGWSGRMEDSILQGCIPVIIQVVHWSVCAGSQALKVKSLCGNFKSVHPGIRVIVPAADVYKELYRTVDNLLDSCLNFLREQDGIFLPYENVLNYKNFAVRISEDEIPNLIHILQKINETEIEFMLANVRQIWQRFLYRDSVLLEAQRQKRLFADEEDWAVEFSKLKEDDVFSTFIQILLYKLHNDPWRRHFSSQKKYGLPKACLRTTH